jgi:hypothetical protein
MVLTEVSCIGERHDTVVLVFAPACADRILAARRDVLRMRSSSRLVDVGSSRCEVAGMPPPATTHFL